MQHVWINHDHDLLDVSLRQDGQDGRATQASSSDKTQQVATKAHGSQAPPPPSSSPSDASDETIHTTAKHPWLTTDRGWVQAGNLRLGEHVVALDGHTATITALAVHPGAATYYNLTVSQLHTYAVGSGQYVVHNTNCDQVKFLADQYANSIAESAGITGAAKQRATIAVEGVQNGEGTRFLASLNQSAWEHWGQPFADAVEEFKAAHPDVNIELVPQQEGAWSTHAEANVDAFGRENGLTFQGIGASNHVCIDCAPRLISEYGFGSIGSPYNVPPEFPGALDPNKF